MIRGLFGGRADKSETADARSPALVGGGQPDAIVLVDAAIAAFGDRSIAEPEARELPAVQALLAAPERTRAAALLELVERRLAPRWGIGLWTVTSLLARRRLVLEADELRTLLATLLLQTGKDPGRSGSVIEHVSSVVERSVEALSGEARLEAAANVRTLIGLIESDTRARVKPAAMTRLRGLISDESSFTLDAITLDDGVGPAMRAAIERQLSLRKPFVGFVTHLLAATKAGRPSARWMDQTRAVASPGAAELGRAIFQAALDAGDSSVVYDYTATGHGRIEMARFVSPGNEATLRNAVWASAALADAEAIPLLRALAQKCITVIGGQFGNPRSLAIALACPAAIGAIGAPASLTALQGLQRSVRHGSVLREINKAIDALAVASDVSRSELLETSIEHHDLRPDGTRHAAVGSWPAVLSVDPSGEVVVDWRDPDGEQRASLPKAVREAATDQAKSVATTTKAIRDTVAAERARLDRLFLEARRWPLSQWRDRYLAHPITGTLVRALLWRFATPTGVVVGLPMADGGSVSDVHGATVPIPASADVTIWHPIEATEDDVRAWRERLLAERRAQPLKQVFREIYTVTPAEQATRTYSNRFASHIIRQVQARALMKGRGWAPVAVAWWDDGIDQGVARRKLEPHNLRVEFFYDPITDIQPTSTDLWPYCSTDQVRFFDLDGDRAVEVDRVPPVAFSEVMRDVDLFVGVTTIGADAQWLDRGERRFDTYWHRWGFGELGEPAKVRRQVIASLLPALRIADRCTLSDRFLEVRGDLRSYKIHLGSSNIQMSPADRYLCIVAARHPSDDRLFLPFDDDPMLSLILSKAFLLAADSSITDESIVRQIGAG